MTSKLLLRMAAGCLLFFAVGHSAGHFTRHDVSDPKAKEILELMINNKFDMFGQMRSYDENYTGMSLNLIITLLALTCLVWIAAGYVKDYPMIMKKILIPIAGCVLVFSVTGFLFFFPVPAVTCLIAAVLISVTIIRLNKTEV